MKLFFTLFFILSYFALQAQEYKLNFVKADSSKTVTITKKDLARLSYFGYLHEPQVAEGVVTSINDSAITLSPRKKLFKKRGPSQTVLIRDISGFRRYSRFRPAGEIIYGIVGVGITGTVTAIVSSANPPAALSFLTAASTQTITTFIRGLFISNKIKYHLQDGWKAELKPE